MAGYITNRYPEKVVILMHVDKNHIPSTSFIPECVLLHYTTCSICSLFDIAVLEFICSQSLTL